MTYSPYDPSKANIADSGKPSYIVQFRLTHALWTVIACSLLIYGLLTFGWERLHHGLCHDMFCQEFDVSRQILRGVYGVSLALLVYGRWDRDLEIMIPLALLLAPIHLVLDSVRIGGLTNVSPEIYGSPLVRPTIAGEVLAFPMFGISHALCRRDLRYVVALFAFIVLISNLAASALDPWGVVPAPGDSVVFAVACALGLRFWVNQSRSNHALQTDDAKQRR